MREMSLQAGEYWKRSELSDALKGLGLPMKPANVLPLILQELSICGLESCPLCCCY
jgi:hypothetical protein